MVARNYCLMQLRDKAKVPIQVTEKMMVTEPDETDNLLHLRQKDEALEIMQESLKELNEEQRNCITLFYLQKKSYNEIAGMTGYTPALVKSYIQNGKRNLKIIMKKRMMEKNPYNGNT